MKIYQVLVTLQRGDAIGNHAMLLADLLRKHGYQVETYAYNIGKGFSGKQDHVYDLRKIPQPKQNDLVLYHLCEASPFNRLIQTWKCKKIAIYHNVTPPHFFAWLDQGVAAHQKESLKEVASLKNTFDQIIADSPFNKQELIRMGFPEEKIVTIPIMIQFSDYAQQPDEKTIETWKDGRTNILFVGRVAPNKKQEDIIRGFAWYKKHIDTQARLILIGSAFSETYLYYLKEYIAALGVEDVVFPGHISFQEILGFYRSADVFLCMSEHEGFCAPLIEAMFFHVPIVAYDSTAIASTLGNGGILLKQKNPVLVGKTIELLMKDQQLREQVIEEEKERIELFSLERVGRQFLKTIQEVVEKV